MTDSLDTLGGGHPCEVSAASSRCFCHICCLQAVYLGYFVISLLPRFLKCHLCLMAVLISCIWKTHSGHYQLHFQSGFMPNSLVRVIRHSPVPWQLVPQMMQKLKSSNYLQLSLSAYIASECVLTRLLYQCSEKPNLKQHPSCWVCEGHLGDYTGSSALRIALYLGAILLCMGKVGEGRVVHDWDCDGDKTFHYLLVPL